MGNGEAPVAALTDLSDLPSAKAEGNKAEAKIRAQRDKRVAKTARLKSWDGKKLRYTVTCYKCHKIQGIYARNDADYYAAKDTLQQKLESVSHCFCCRNLLFDDNHQLCSILH